MSSDVKTGAPRRRPPSRLRADYLSSLLGQASDANERVGPLDDQSAVLLGEGNAHVLVAAPLERAPVVLGVDVQLTTRGEQTLRVREVAQVHH